MLLTQTSNTLGVDARISPEKSLGILSPYEVEQLFKTTQSDIYQLFRRCTLAVLNCGTDNDDIRSVLGTYADYDVEVIQQCRGIKLELKNAPSSAFVDGDIIQGIKEHLFSVLRDLVYNQILIPNRLKAAINGEIITEQIFQIMRNAGALHSGEDPNIVVCWGGHSIGREEYDYSKEVGYELGLRGFNIGTGCGPGAMKGPMKGATIAHAKQHVMNGRYIGITEPGIIAAEPPNPIVNELVILPDIEKRLETFIRVGHGIVVFPGGVGTAEEILYLLGVLLNPVNDDIPFPVIFTAPQESASYFSKIDEFIGKTLGHKAQNRYEIIINNPKLVAQKMKAGIEQVKSHRIKTKDAFYFNWMLEVDSIFQTPFEPTHENVGQLDLNLDQEKHLLAANLRRAFSAIVSGNVKEAGIRMIEKHGPFELSGEPPIMEDLDDLLRSFAESNRMKLGGRKYSPCYVIKKP